MYKSVLFFQHDSIDSINVDPDPTNPIRSVWFETGVRDLCVKIGKVMAGFVVQLKSMESVLFVIPAFSLEKKGTVNLVLVRTLE